MAPAMGDDDAGGCDRGQRQPWWPWPSTTTPVAATSAVNYDDARDDVRGRGRGLRRCQWPWPWTTTTPVAATMDDSRGRRRQCPWPRPWTTTPLATAVAVDNSA